MLFDNLGTTGGQNRPKKPQSGLGSIVALFLAKADANWAEAASKAFV